MTGDQVLVIAGVHVVGFWVLVWYVFRLRKQLRCLGCCYIDIGDWGIGKIIEARDDYIHQYGEQVTPYTMLRAQGEYDNMLVKHRRMFADIGMTTPGTREMNYILEGII